MQEPVCVFMEVDVHVCMCMWRSEVNLGCLSIMLTLLELTGSEQSNELQGCTNLRPQLQHWVTAVSAAWLPVLVPNADAPGASKIF